MFCYCGNNPVINSDPTGCFRISSIINPIRKWIKKFISFKFYFRRIKEEIKLDFIAFKHSAGSVKSISAGDANSRFITLYGAVESSSALKLGASLNGKNWGAHYEQSTQSHELAVLIKDTYISVSSSASQTDITVGTDVNWENLGIGAYHKFSIDNRPLLLIPVIIFFTGAEGIIIAPIIKQFA